VWWGRLREAERDKELRRGGWRKRGGRGRRTLWRKRVEEVVGRV